MKRINISFVYKNRKEKIIITEHIDHRPPIIQTSNIHNNPLDKYGEPTTLTWAAFWAPLILNYIIHNELYSNKEYMRVDRFVAEQFKNDPRYKKTNFYELVHRVIDYLNNNPLKDYPLLEIDRDEFRLIHKDDIAMYRVDISWEIIGTRDALAKNHIDEKWQSKYIESEKSKVLYGYKTEDIKEECSDISAYRASVRKIGEVCWRIRDIRNMCEQYADYGSAIRPDLLPEVSVNGTVYSSLEDFVCNHYVELSEYSNDIHLAVIEGEIGSGKTYSIKMTAAKLNDMRHIAIVVDLDDMYGPHGACSIAEHLCRYIEGNNGGCSEHIVGELLSHASEDRKVMIFLDGLHDVYPCKYSVITAEIKTIMGWNNPNVYLMIAARNPEEFLADSEIIGTDKFSEFNRIKVCPAAGLNEMTASNGSYHMLKNGEMPATPLLISCIRDGSAVSGTIYRDPQNYAGLSEYLGSNTSEFIEKNIHQDLAVIYSETVKEHAKKKGRESIWYTIVVPEIAFWMLTEGQPVFTEQVIGELLDENRIINDVYKWSYNEIVKQFPAFAVMTSSEKFRFIAGTGFFKNIEEHRYAFCYDEICCYMAVAFATQVIKKSEDRNLYRKVIGAAINITNSLQEDENDKLKWYAHFAGELFKSTVIHHECDETDSSSDMQAQDFDSDLFRLGANIVGYVPEIMPDLKTMKDVLKRYKRGRYMFPRRQRVIKSLEDERNIEALLDIVLAEYEILRDTMSNDSEKCMEFSKLCHDLNYAVGAAMLDAFGTGRKAVYKEINKIFSRRWNDEFSIRIMEKMVFMIREDESLNRIDRAQMDVILKAYNALALVKYEMGEFKVSRRFNELAEEYKETAFSKGFR